MQELVNLKNDQPEVLMEEVQSIGRISKFDNITYKQSLNKYKFDGMTEKQMWAFSQGHFQNDLQGAIWFNFLPFYLVAVLRKGHIAAWTLLIGQVFDGFMSPLVGIFCEKTDTKYGQKTPWYFFGTLICFISTIPMYIIQLPEGIPDWIDYTYYILFPVLQNLGGATVMIVHMSFVPALTCSRMRRDVLNSRRNTFSFIGNFFILVLSLIIFQTVDNGVSSFRWIAGISLAIGMVSSIYFLYVIEEIELTNVCKKCVQDLKYVLGIITKSKYAKFANENGEETDDGKVNWKQWFTERLFYQIGCIYMLARLYFNIVSIMILFYVVHTLKIIKNPEELSEKQMPFDVAFIPLLMWIGSLLTSSKLEKVYALIGKKNTLTIGMGIICLTSFTYWVLTPATRFFIYPLAILTGMTQAIILTTGITLIGEVVGNRGASSSYVYGIYCFLDKTLTGIVLYYVCQAKFTGDYIRDVMTKLPFFTAVLVWILLLTTPLKFEQKNKEEALLEENDEIKQLRDEFVQ